MVISTMVFINSEFSAGEAVSVLSLTRLIEKAAILCGKNCIIVNRDERHVFATVT